MQNFKHHLRGAFICAAGYGTGFVLGSLLSYLLFISGLADLLLNYFTTGRLVIGLLLVLVTIGIGGAVTGAIGGAALSLAHQSPRKVSHAWRSALSFAVSNSIIIIPMAMAVSLISFYDLSEMSPIGLMIPLWMLGGILGAAGGLVLGLLTVSRRDTWRVALTGTISFACGGSALGSGLWSYLNQIIEKDSSAIMSLFGGLFMFGVVGGAGLGFLYSWLAHRRVEPALPFRFSAWLKQLSRGRRIAVIAGLALLVLIIRALWLISPFTAEHAVLSSTLESHTIDTHWAAPVSLTGSAIESPGLFVSAQGAPTIAWVEGSDIFYLTDSAAKPVNVSNSAAQSSGPQIVVDRQGRVHLVWVEAAGASAGTEIFYTQCAATGCPQPVSLSSVSGLSCLPQPLPQNSEPALAINSADNLMVSWRNGQGKLLYATWAAGAPPPKTASGCIPGEVPGQQPRLAAAPDGSFRLISGAPTGQIYLTRYAGNVWGTPEQVGQGFHPEISVDAGGQPHAAWCGADQSVSYLSAGGKVEQLPQSRCTGRPAMAIRPGGKVRLVWYANALKNVRGVIQPNTLLVESFLTGRGWTAPAIVAQTQAATQPALAADDSGQLHLAWAGNTAAPSALNYATHSELDCSQAELSTPGQAIYEAVRQEKFRPATDVIPYCNNRFDRLMYAPNPVAAYSEAEPTPNGTFDKFAELAKTAQYEMVFATMWYDGFKKVDSPGQVLGRAVANLYQQVKENPANYPRGMTVRILLGNPPAFALFPTFNNQVWSLIKDLRDAGVPELRNDDIGWNVEVANYGGGWPHSHTKLMVVDGKTVQSVGYNMQYTHLPVDHPSGKGKGRVDLGLQITGPAAQSSLRAFDELWQASTHIHCPGINSSLEFLWVFSCDASRAAPYHAPEVLRYFVPEDTGSHDNGFAIFRTEKFHEGDEAYGQALASATSSLDIIHINFSLDIICALNLLVEACNYNNRVEFMDGLMQGIENGAKARILVSDVAWVGIENNVAINVLEQELADRGLSDRVEIRYFEQDMHIKSALVDNEILIVGNQNFHYSAWGGKGSLAEYNLSTESPKAIENYRRFFEYYWNRAKKQD